MENLNNIDKIKENLIEELEKIKDDKRIIFDELKNLQKEESVINNHIDFFQKYLTHLENGYDDTNLNLNKFVEDNKHNTNQAMNNITQTYPPVYSTDLIEENIKAFDRSLNYSNANSNTNVNEKSNMVNKCKKFSKNKAKNQKKRHLVEIDKKTIIDEFPSSQQLIMNNNVVSKDNLENLHDDNNYFVELIKKNFDN
jgi:hypothetical protein